MVASCCRCCREGGSGVSGGGRGAAGTGAGGNKDQEEGKAFVALPVNHWIQCGLLEMVLRPPIWTLRKRSVQTPVAGPLVPPSDRWRSQSDSLPGGSSAQHGPLAAHHVTVCLRCSRRCLSYPAPWRQVGSARVADSHLGDVS